MYVLFKSSNKFPCRKEISFDCAIDCSSGRKQIRERGKKQSPKSVCQRTECVKGARLASAAKSLTKAR